MIILFNFCSKNGEEEREDWKVKGGGWDEVAGRGERERGREWKKEKERKRKKNKKKKQIV